MASMLVAMVVIALLVAVAMFGGLGPRESKRADGLGVTVQGGARASVLDISCRNNLSQIRMSLQNFYGEDGPPATLEDLKFPSEMLECPIGHEKYQYTPSIGKVKCLHPGHGKF